MKLTSSKRRGMSLFMKVDYCTALSRGPFLSLQLTAPIENDRRALFPSITLLNPF